MASPKQNSKHASNERPNSLGLQGRALQSLLDELDEHGEGHAAIRQFHRWPHRLERVFIKIRQPGGQESIIRVVCRNVSQGGMAVLHNSFTHAGSPCAVILPHLTDGPTAVRGKVVRCQHRRGVIHELGIKFDKPINIRDYIPQGNSPTIFALERVDPAQLQGCMVLVDPDDMDIRVIQHYLRDSSVRIRHARDAAQAVDMVREGCDLIMVNQWLGDTAGLDVVAQLRAERSTVPVVMLVTDSSAGIEQEAARAKINAILNKPLAQDAFLRALGDHLLESPDDAGAEPVASASPASASDNPFAARAQTLAASLAKGLAHGDIELCRKACLELLGESPGAGMHALADIAAEAAASLTSTQNVELSRAKVEALIEGCLRAEPPTTPAAPKKAAG